MNCARFWPRIGLFSTSPTKLAGSDQPVTVIVARGRTMAILPGDGFDCNKAFGAPETAGVEIGPLAIGLAPVNDEREVVPTVKSIS